MKKMALSAVLAIQQFFGAFGDPDQDVRTKFQCEIGGVGAGKKRTATPRLRGNRKHPIGKLRNYMSLDLRPAREWSRRNGVKWGQ